MKSRRTRKIFDMVRHMKTMLFCWRLVMFCNLVLAEAPAREGEGTASRGANFHVTQCAGGLVMCT